MRSYLQLLCCYNNYLVSLSLSQFFNERLIPFNKPKSIDNNILSKILLLFGEDSLNDVKNVLATAIEYIISTNYTFHYIKFFIFSFYQKKNIRSFILFSVFVFLSLYYFVKLFRLDLGLHSVQTSHVF